MMYAVILLLALAVVGGLLALAMLGPARIADSIEGTIKLLSTSARQGLCDYVDIENVDLNDAQTFVHKDGSLMTILRHRGSLRMVGAEEFDDADQAINTALAAYLGGGGHAIQTVFAVDPDITEREIREAQEPHRATARRLGMSLEDLFEEEARHMASRCASESCFIALYTRPAALTAQDRKVEAEARKELFKSHTVPLMSDAPNLFRVARQLRIRHQSFVDAFLQDLKHQKLVCEPLEVHEASREIRYAIDPDWTDEQWRPCLVGDPIPNRDIKRNPQDMTGKLWPVLGPQLAPRDAVRLNQRQVRIGGRTYQPMFVDLAPQDIQVFQRLFGRTAESGLPWRMSLLVESAGGLWDFKNLAAMMLWWSNRANNGTIRRAVDSLRDGAELEGRTRVRLRIDLATWAPADAPRLLEQRASQLARAVEGWGKADIGEISGDPTQALMGSVPGATLKSVATPSLAYLDDVTHFLPLYRPASPWVSGGILFRTPDGKVWPFQPHSPVQSSHINLIYAEPRSGKSVLGNKINLALCLSPGIVRFPLICIIDIGRSSSGLISLLESELPASKRHLVASIRMRPTPDYAINPCDTQLGCRTPLEYEMAALLNLVLTLVTPHGREAADPAMSNLARMAIEHAYRNCADEGNAKLYAAHTEGAASVDRAIKAYGLHVDDNTTWWEIVDGLFERGAVHDAMLAQRFAVPLIADIAAAASAPQFADLYGEKTTEDGTEPVLKSFTRMLSESVRAYPVLSHPTKFDIGDARVVSIDLDEVAKSGSAAADHQTAVYYMLARIAVAKNFYLHTDDLYQYPDRYRAYHEVRIKEFMEDKKHIQYDEFHRTKKIRAVREQTVADMREGGKRGVMISLISQDIGDFDPIMLTFASCKMILSRADEATVTQMKAVFGLSQTVEWNVRNSIRPPSKRGSTFVGMWKIRESEADCAHALNNTMGGIQLWAFSTSNEDTIVRSRLYEQLGPAETRMLLARLFPGGSILDELERRKKNMSEGTAESVIDGLVADLLMQHRQRGTASNADIADMAAPTHISKRGYG